MKKFLFGFLLFFVGTMLCFTTTGCTDRKSAQDSLSIDAMDTDSLSSDALERSILEHPMPKAADELFSDFLFNFMSRKDVQYSRIHFPLPVETNNTVSKIEKRKWKLDKFFSNMEFYTLMFDNRAQMSLINDTSVNKATLEKIYLDKHYVKQYFFERPRGEWRMTKIRSLPIASTSNASFLTFYSRFVTDSLFQLSSIASELSFSGPNPDDEFNNIEGNLLPEQFSSFAPPMPKGMMYNIIYDEPKKDSDTKILLIEGIANGIQSEMVFRRVAGKWKLFKMSM